MRSRRAAAALLLLGLWLGGADAGATIDPGSPTGVWRAIDYPLVAPDWSDDQQTGIPEADIVGDTSHPGVYVQFDSAGTPSTTDGSLAFRVRLGADKPPAGFDFFFGVGIDANLDGALDLFVGVNNSGAADELGIWSPGSDLNVSPSTTSIVNPPLVSYAESASNYGFQLVDSVIDPPATIFDLDNDGNVDYFLSFVIPFQDIVNQLVAAGFPGFDESSMVQYVVGTSTQPNALNQDLGGPDGGVRSDQTWAQLGAVSVPMTPTPEPGGLALLGVALVAVMRARRRGGPDRS